MSEQDRLAPEAHLQIFESEILPESGIRDRTSHERPRAIILAGQPGAGKGSLAGAAKTELNNDAVTVDPDALRDYHPEVDDFRSESPYTWAGKTHADASQWAKELRAAAIDGRKNLILDTTLGNGGSAIELIRDLQGKGYTVDVRVMASPRLESELGVEQRFSRSFDDRHYGRYVPNGIRDDVYEALPKNLDQIQAQTDVQIRIFNREGSELFDNRTDTRLPGVALGEAREARLRDPAITRTLRDGWKDQQNWHRDLSETLRDNPRVDSQTDERLLTERAQESVVERMNKTAKEAFDVDHATRIRPAQIRAGRVLGIAGLAIDAYDGAQTYRTVSRLRSEGNDIAAESELIHFGSRSIGGLSGAAVGAGAGGLATSWSGPGMLIGGGVGGIVGVFGGEKFAEWTDNRRIYNQEDGRGNTWTFDPEQPQGGWRRGAPGDVGRVLHQAISTDHSMTPKKHRKRYSSGLALKASAICLVFVLAACQQAVSTSAAASSSREPVIQTASSAEVAKRASVPQAEDWKLSISPGKDQTYRIHVAGADGREVQVIDGQEGEPPYLADALLKLDDFTGDGKPDILARGLSAGASALTSERIYVYDAGMGRFRNADPFRNDGEVTKTVEGCIAVEYRNPDNMTYSKDQYCWKNDKWEFQRTTKD